MLISFSLENWMSFRDEVTFSMVATSERQHKDRVPRVRKYPANILPIAAIYGANASGKTNLVKALRFVKELVVDGTKLGEEIDITPFLLDAKMGNKPSRFRFELLIDETIYEFSFAVTRKEILEEKLVHISSAKEKVLYHRKDGKPHFDDSLARNESLQVVFRGTQDNQLFLTNSVSQKIKKFQPVFDWFEDKLRILSPGFRPIAFRDEESLLSTMGEVLSQFDTGIARLGSEETSPMEIRPSGRFSMSGKDGLKKLVTYHPKVGGGEVQFNFQQESAGTKRIIDLLPEFLSLSEQDSKKVYVIDEVDYSLHTLLTRKLLEAHLANCTTETRAQLIFTTHDLLLMDRELLRHDEMWVTDKDADEVSKLIALSDFEGILDDKDIRGSYLLGRFGGIPRVFWGDALTNASLNKEDKGED